MNITLKFIIMKSKNLFLLYSVVVLAFIGGSKLKSQVTIDGNVRYQTIDGFGFSDGWSGILSEVKKDALFDTIGMTIFRAFKFHPDFNGAYNTPSENISAAKSKGATVFCTYWPPEEWEDGNNHLSTSHYADYANWIINNVTDIDIVSPFNEPNLNNAIEMTGEEIKDFIKNYGETLSNTRPIIVGEAFNFDDNTTDPTLNDSVACSRITYIGGHFYGGGNRVHQNALDKGKHVWQTEYCYTNSQTNISDCMIMAQDINKALNNQFSAYVWWWVRDAVDDGTNLVNNDGTIYKNGYIMGQFAKFIRPGMQRIEATYNPTSEVYVTSYVNNENEVVIVTINTGTSSKSQAFILQNLNGAGSFNIYRTSGSQNMARIGNVNVYNRSFSLDLPPQSITTLVQAKGVNPNDIWMEAEFRKMGSLWETHSDSTASNGKYVTVQPGHNSTGNAPADTSGHITYGFKVNESGTYTVWGRVIIPAMDDDAFWVKMDSTAWFSWDSITPSTSWTWAKIDTFVLNEGGHFFTVAYNKDGPLLDKLFITRSDSIPSGMGGPAFNTSPNNTLPIANAGTDIKVVDSDSTGNESIFLNGLGSIDLDGFIVSYEWREGDSLIATGATDSVEFSVGIHTITLTVTDNEGATATSKVEFTILPKNYLDSNIGLEAECGIVGANWEIIEDAQTSNGYYVTSKPGYQSKDQAPASKDGLISMSFDVKSAGNYYVYARINCPTPDDDSYWIKMDGGSFTMYNNLSNSGWGWAILGNYSLTEGEHTLTIGYREDGAKLDKIIVSRYTELPEGFGTDAVNTCDTPTVAPPDTSVIVNSISENEINYSLKQIYPNPFNMSTVIKYDLKDAGHINISVYNLVGDEIETIVDKNQPAGEYKIVWQVGDLPSGIYFCKFKVGDTVETRKIIIQK
jgi:glucuronoarabinoxylan endo-1,4-beta-xylanase